jgi:hypothetical protein
VKEQVSGVSTKTQNLHALVEGAEGAAGAFEAAAGASALFGEKSEELEKTTQRLVAVMALANGIQKIYRVTEEENAAVAAIARGQRALQAVATRLAAAAESEYTVVRIAATAAQAALNAVMLANPVLLLIGALVAAGAALYAFSSDTDKAAEAQKKLNEEQKLAIEYLEQYQKVNTLGLKDRIDDAKAELEVLKAKNVSQGQILEKEKEITKLERQLAGNNAGFFADEIKNVNALNVDLETLKGKLEDLQHERDNKQSGNFFTRWLYGERTNEDIDKDIENTKAKIENTQKSIEQGENAQKDAQAKRAADEAKAEEIRKHNVEQALRDQIGYAEARLALTKQTTRDELDAEIGLIHRKQALELNDANLTAGQRLAIEQQNARQIRDLIYSYNLEQAKGNLAIYQAYAAGKLKTVNAGSVEELEIEKQLLIQKREVDVLAARDNIQEIQRIRLQFEADYTALLKNFARQRQLDAIESEKLINQARIDAAEAGSHEEYELKLQAIAIEQRADIAAIDDRVRNTEKGQAQIAEINARAAQQQLALRRQYLQKEIEFEQATATEINDIRITRLQNQANRPGTGPNKQFQLQQAQRQIELDNIAVELKATQDLYKNKLISQEEYIQRSLELENKRLAKQGESDNAELSHKKQFYSQLIDLGIQQAQDLANTVFAINDNNIRQQEENQKAALDRDKEATLNQKFLTNQQRAVIDESFRRQEVANERKAAIQKRDNEVNQAEVDGFLAIAKVWSEHADNPIVAAILTALAVVKTTEQVSKIKSTPLPTFAVGTEMVEGPGTGTSDSIIARLSRGERVVTAETNSKYFPALSAIHKNLVPPEVANALLTGSVAASLPAIDFDGGRLPVSTIDYQQLGKAVADHIAPHLASLPLNTFSFDEKGFVESVRRGLDTQIYLTKRYGTK